MSYRKTVDYHYSLLYIPVLLVTVIGVPLTILTIRFYARRIRKTSSSTALFLTFLAVFDMLALVTSIPTVVSRIYDFFVDEWNESRRTILLGFGHRLPIFWSNMVLLLVAIERLISVVLPHHVKHMFTSRLAIGSIVIVLLVGPVILFPMPIKPPLEIVPTNGSITHLEMPRQTILDQDLYVGVTLVGMCFYFGFPVIGVLACNICLVISLLYKSRSKLARNLGKALTPLQMKELRTTKVVTIVTFVFILCVLPLVILFPLTTVSGSLVPVWVVLIVRPVSDFLEAINNSMNFVVYYNRSRNFRTEIKELISRIRFRSQQNTIVPLHIVYRRNGSTVLPAPNLMNNI